MEMVTKQKVKKILSITATVLVWAFVAFALLTTVLVFTAQGDKDGIPALFGKSLITIESESMEDTFKKGDLIWIDKISGTEDASMRLAELDVDDIITYWAPVDINKDGQLNDINTHRIVEKLDNGFKTKGDNNDLNDTYRVGYSDIIGVAHEDDRIGGVGAVIGFLRTSLGFFLCILLPLVLFFLYELYRFIRLILSERPKRATVSAEQEEEIKRRAIEEYLAGQGADKPTADAPDASAAPAEKKDGE